MRLPRLACRGLLVCGKCLKASPPVSGWRLIVLPRFGGGLVGVDNHERAFKGVIPKRVSPTGLLPLTLNICLLHFTSCRSKDLTGTNKEHIRTIQKPVKDMEAAMIEFIKDIMAFISLSAFSITALMWIELLRNLG